MSDSAGPPTPTDAALLSFSEGVRDGMNDVTILRLAGNTPYVLGHDLGLEIRYMVLGHGDE